MPRSRSTHVRHGSRSLGGIPSLRSGSKFATVDRSRIDSLITDGVVVIEIVCSPSLMAQSSWPGASPRRPTLIFRRAGLHIAGRSNSVRRPESGQIRNRSVNWPILGQDHAHGSGAPYRHRRIFKLVTSSAWSGLRLSPEAQAETRLWDGNGGPRTAP